MSYKIAVSSTDGIRIDQSFGATKEFYIYEVDGLSYTLAEKRQEASGIEIEETKLTGYCNQNKQCNQGEAGGCGTGGCGAEGGHLQKVDLVADCRCIVCKKIGFQAQKQLEKLAISSFDVECTIEEALSKIVNYLYKVDSHQSLRGVTKDNQEDSECM